MKQLLLAACVSIACGVSTPTSVEPSSEPAGPLEGEECMTPEQSRRGGDAPRTVDQQMGDSPPREHEGDANGCAPRDVVFNNCCCNALEGPRFDGTQCCYRFDICGCC